MASRGLGLPNAERSVMKTGVWKVPCLSVSHGNNGRVSGF